MTAQQAGVSADRIQEVQELVDLLPHGDCTAQQKMADCLRCRITDRLAALATAPPEQAAREYLDGSPAWWREHPPNQSDGITFDADGRAYKGQPQAASGGALDDNFAEIIKELRGAQYISGTIGPIEKRVKEAFNWIADRIERLLEATPIIHGQAELAAHDQKVRAETLEEAAQEVLKLEKWGPIVPGLEHPFQDSAAAIRSLASGAEEKK